MNILGNRRMGLVAVLGCLLTLGLCAGSARAEAPAGQVAARRIHSTMVVTGIDRTTRTVSLQDADGEMRTVGVPPDMKSFDTLKVGDHVDVDYYESIGLSLMPPGTKSSMSESTSGGRVAPGVASAGREITANVEVVGVDQVMNKVTFKGPKGNVRTVTVYDPAMQKRVANLQPGQMVQITYREAMAAAIRPTASSK
jgi:hypothetical protein